MLKLRTTLNASTFVNHMLLRKGSKMRNLPICQAVRRREDENKTRPSELPMNFQRKAVCSLQLS